MWPLCGFYFCLSATKAMKMVGATLFQLLRAQ
jgi:hypothetical protein